MTRNFSGKRMAIILVSFFGVVIVVNLVMARLAVSTFGGVVVENSYVASQEFNRWLEEAEAERALGWEAVTAWRPDGRLAIAVDGPGETASLAGIARHPLGRLEDRELSFERAANGTYVSREILPPGRWTLRLRVEYAGQVWRREESLQ